jgi:hypothetical protein
MKGTRTKAQSSPSQAKAEAMKVMKCKAAGCGMPTKKKARGAY